MLFKKTVLFALVAALAVAGLPFVSASAAGTNEPTPPPSGEVSNEKLEKAWAHQLRVYEWMGKAGVFFLASFAFLFLTLEISRGRL